MEEENVEEALKQYGKAEVLFLQNLEMRYWKAIALANGGRLEEALPIFKENDNWYTLTRRLPVPELLNVSKSN